MPEAVNFTPKLKKIEATRS